MAEHQKLSHQKADFDGLYEWQQQNLKGPDIVQHDSIPYANGNAHIGHGLDMIMKDVINRYHVINGRRVHFTPGWDCHGLPIELKALNALKISHKSLHPVELRKIARNFALDTSKKQKATFKEIGIMADWEKNVFYTLDKSYVQNQIRQFYNMYKKGLIYREFKPVYWSPASVTALAESELEYDPNHKSTEIYLKLTLTRIPDDLKRFGSKIDAVIWTTTPWSLVGNQAICFSPDLQYSLVRDGDSLLIIASALKQHLETVLERTLNEIHTFNGDVLSEAQYNHPLKSVTQPFHSAAHVSANKGTGLEHSAPAHRLEDFLVARKHNIKIECYVDNNGNFCNFSEDLNGLFALNTGQQRIIELLNDHILYSGSYIHSYPLDWRTKTPVIIKASNQWFIDTSAIRKQALAALNDVKILPAATSDQFRQSFVQYLTNRSYWCISRQRNWGTPIPVVYYNDKPLINEEMIDRICDVIERDGTDSWWNDSLEEFVPKNLTDAPIDRLVKGTDVMDIWVDSGMTWSGPKVYHPNIADVNFGGPDQINGWFQSSLLISVALRGFAPYKSIYIHGVAVDSNGQKMSKSLGNIITPEMIINGGKDSKKHPAYGVDTFRWWITRNGTGSLEFIVCNNVLDERHSEIGKLRSLVKLLIGCINDIDKNVMDLPQNNSYLDAYMLHLLYRFCMEAKSYYENLEFTKVAPSVLNFTDHLSTFYLHAIKDRLYYDKQNALNRRNSQVVINHTLMQLFQILAPIIPHFVEELWTHHPLYDNVPFFQISHENPRPIWERPYLDDLMDNVFEIKQKVHKSCAGSNTLQFSANVRTNPELFDKLMLMQNAEESIDGDICDILQVSRVRLIKGRSYEDLTITVEPIDQKPCKRCRKYTSKHELCERCRPLIDA